MLPKQVRSLVHQALGKNGQAEVVLEAIADTMHLENDERLIKVNASKLTQAQPRTIGDIYISWNGSEEFRPDDALSWSRIESMDKSGIVQFALKMKLAQMVGVFKSDSGWRIESSDEEQAEVHTAAFRHVLPPMMYDLIESALRCGMGAVELVYRSATKFDLGISEETGGKEFTVLADAKSVNPKSIKHLKRQPSSGKFDGFVQSRWGVWNSQTKGEDIDVPLASALILTYQERYRNKYGISLYEAIYPIWFWYQVVLRSMVRYMERMGTPVTIVDAPGNRYVYKPGTTEEVDALELGLEIAANAARQNALSIPSDRDQNGNRLWDIRYLTADERSQPFIEVLERMSVMILRAALLADRSLTGGDVGGFNVCEIHDIANSIHNQMVLMLFVRQIDDYLMPRLAVFNSGKTAAPMRLVVQGIDLREREMLQALIGVSGNIPAAQEAMGRVDWVKMAERAGVPTISQEEYDAQKKKLEDESLDKQRKMIEMQQEAAGPPPDKGTSTAPAARNSAIAKKAAVEAAKMEESINDFVQLLRENDVLVPVVVGPDELQLWNPRQPRDRYGKWSSGGGFSNAPRFGPSARNGAGFGFGSQSSFIASRTRYTRNNQTGITKETYTKGPFKERYKVTNFKVFGKPAPHTAFNFLTDGEFEGKINAKGIGKITSFSPKFRVRQKYTSGRFVSRYQQVNYRFKGKAYNTEAGII